VPSAGSDTKAIEAPTLVNVQKAYDRWRERCSRVPENIALLYFAGHGICTGSQSQFLLLDDFADVKTSNLWANCIDFFCMRDGLKGCKASTQLYFVDACRDIPVEVAMQRNPRGECLGAANILEKVNSYTYYSASDGNKAYGPENGITFFLDALLKSLDGPGVEIRNGRRVITTSSLATSLQAIVDELGKQSGHQLSSAIELDGGSVELHFPAASRASNGHALDEALGYATQAFRDYLNQHVVKNVELIYFLSYDVWDGCLLYDGLVHGSIEQRLLDYIRHSFLNRDRLRSRYEELDAEGKELGAAGQCFRDALQFASKTNAAGEQVALDRLWYIGDLTKYKSEYRTFDRLLGLVSCLYIPVVGNLLPVLADRPSRSPFGGVLMAGNRRPYGLEPRDSATEPWKQACQLFVHGNPMDAAETSVWAKDKEIACAITEMLRARGLDGDVGHFLACIGGVYSQKARARSELRRLIHPRFIKAVARNLKHVNIHEEERRHKAIEQIGDRANKTPPAQRDWPHKFAEDFGTYTAVIKEDIADHAKKDLVRDYVMACIWRDLKLTERELLREAATRERQQGLNDIQHALLAAPPLARDPAGSLDDYIRTRSQPDSRQLISDDETLRPGDTARFQRELVENLIDDLRELQGGAFDTLFRPLRNLAPIERYLRGIADIEALLASTSHRRLLHQLAHSLQVWMLGAWMLEQKLDGERTLRDRVLTLIYEYFKDTSAKLGPPARLRDKWGQPDAQIIDLFWGLIAATHDIATPLQSFQDWCRDFFIKYFEERTVASFDMLPALLDVFHHPRFPFYKSAITNHYDPQERNWLESIFHRGLSYRIDHALAGSLILMREIEPDDICNGDGFWRKARRRLEELSEKDRPELGLIMPAYISHAVAFSHVADIRWRWLHEHEQMESEDAIRQRGIPPAPTYFTKTAQTFRVSFKKFPLTYLIALCEVLLDSEEDAWIAKMKSRPRVRMVPEDAGRIRVSPLYVKDIEVSAGPPVTIILTLCLWENDLRCEGSFVCDPRRDLTGLRNDFKGDSDMVWVVYEDELYDKEKPNWPVASDGNGWCDVKVGQPQEGKRVRQRKERRVSRSTYEILKMDLRLQEFQESYICDDVQFDIRFENVRHRNDKRHLVSLA
jgi:hypothetical protein